MPFFDVFLNVLAVVGIIALGAFIIVFLSDLLISIIDNSNGIFFKRGQKRPIVDKASRPKLLPGVHEEYDVLTYDASKQNTKSINSLNSNPFDGIDYEKAREEENIVRNFETISEETNNVKNERLRLIEERRREYEKADKIAASKTVIEEKVENFETHVDDIDEIIAEVSKEGLKELEEEEEEVVVAPAPVKPAVIEVAAPVKQEVVEVVKDTKIIEENVKLSKQIEELRKQLEVKTTVHTTIVGISGTNEELEDRLAMLKKRLKEHERELTRNKRDYLPLRRVVTTLENDKKKLRRKEAIVAKQKVILYGVNNYVDIDEDRAKKLAEDLDLLEGLRLSVQHCEEVMQQNKDRYPILERTNKILVKTVEETKHDISAIESELVRRAKDNK